MAAIRRVLTFATAFAMSAVYVACDFGLDFTVGPSSGPSAEASIDAGNMDVREPSDGGSLDEPVEDSAKPDQFRPEPYTPPCTTTHTFCETFEAALAAAWTPETTGGASQSVVQSDSISGPKALHATGPSLADSAEAKAHIDRTVARGYTKATFQILVKMQGGTGATGYFNMFSIETESNVVIGRISRGTELRVIERPAGGGSADNVQIYGSALSNGQWHYLRLTIDKSIGTAVISVDGVSLSPALVLKYAGGAATTTTVRVGLPLVMGPMAGYDMLQDDVALDLN
jgi:hypothetical protein